MGEEVRVSGYALMKFVKHWERAAWSGLPTMSQSCVLVASGVGLGFWLRAQQCLVHCPGQLTEEALLGGT